MKIVYVGPHSAVDIPAAGLTLERGKETKVSAKVAKLVVNDTTIVEAKEETKEEEPAPNKENE